MLTDEQIEQLFNASDLECLSSDDIEAGVKFARAIEAEVRKDDAALIRQMLEALKTCGDGDGYNGPYQYYETVPVEEAVAAARARLEKAP